MGIDIKELRRLHSEATPTPWYVSSLGQIVQTQHVMRDVWIIPHRDVDLELICYLRNHLPALITALEAQEATVDLDTLNASAQVPFERVGTLQGPMKLQGVIENQVLVVERNTDAV
jgi:hypothetical protein